MSNTNFRNIPTELIERRQWVNWKYGIRPGDDKPTKIPHQPGNPARWASSNKPETWGTFGQVVANAERPALADGIGFVLSPDDPYVGLDLDKCIRANGKLKPWAAHVVERMATYTEVSPSGRGIRMFCRGTLLRSVKRPQIEMYDESRFMTMTGNVWGELRPINERQDYLDVLFAEFAKGDVGQVDCQTDLSLEASEVDPFTVCKNPEFLAIWRGETLGKRHASHSEAQMALACWLADLGRAAQEIAELVDASPLGNAEWRNRDKYRDTTIGKAFARAKPVRNFTLADLQALTKNRGDK